MTLHYGTKPGHFETLKIHFPTSEGVSKVSERSEAREQSERGGASKRVSGASERANRRASGLVLQSVFLADLAHSATSFRRFLYDVLTSASGEATDRKIDA